MRNKQNGFGYLYIIIVLIVVAVIGVGWLVWSKSSETSSANDTDSSQSTVSNGSDQERNSATTENDTTVSDGFTTFTGSPDITFIYPNTWTSNSPSTEAKAFGVFADLVSPAQNKAYLDFIASKKPTEGPLNSDLQVSSWGSINEENARGGSSSELKESYKDLNDYISDDAALKNKIGESTINGIVVYEVLIGGSSQSYGVMFEANSKVFEFNFVNIYDKASLTEEARAIISSIQLN